MFTCYQYQGNSSRKYEVRTGVVFSEFHRSRYESPKGLKSPPNIHEVIPVIKDSQSRSSELVFDTSVQKIFFWNYVKTFSEFYLVIYYGIFIECNKTFLNISLRVSVNSEANVSELTENLDEMIVWNLSLKSPVFKWLTLCYRVYEYIQTSLCI